MKRKALTIMTVFVLAAAIMVGATLAYFADYKTASNNFVYNPGGGDDPVHAIGIAEYYWNGTDFGGNGNINPGGATTTGNPTTPDSAGNARLGQAAAIRFSAGTIMGKNPQVKNLGKQDVYVGVRVVLKDNSKASPALNRTWAIEGDISAANSNKFFQIDWKTGATDAWQELTPAVADPKVRYFVLKNSLPAASAPTAVANSVSAPLFTKVTMSNRLDRLIHNADNWDIEIHAYSVQMENGSGTFATPLEALKAQFGSGGVATGTDPGAGHWGAF